MEEIPELIVFIYFESIHYIRNVATFGLATILNTNNRYY